MRIAVYHNLHSGGAKRTLFEEVRRLSPRHHLDLFSLSSADHRFGDLSPFVHHSTIYPFHPGPRFRSPFGRLNQGVRLLDLLRLRRLSRRIAAEIDAAGYDVVLVHPCQYTQSPLVLTFLRTPTVYYCHEPLRKLYEPPVPRPYRKPSTGRRLLDGVDPLLRAYRVALRRADRVSLRSASRVLVNSRFTQENVRQLYGVESRVCPHGVDTEQFRPLDLPRDGTVLSVGALTPNKGFDFLIEGIARIADGRRPSLLIISNYAESQERAYLEALAAERGVSVTFRTGVSNEELVAAYNRAALVAYTPVREPLGLVPLEAMACGTPVVGVREGGVPETVRHGETGLLVERRPEALAQAIRRLLEDPALARQMGERGRRYVCEQWGWEQAVAALEEHLRAAAGG
ncbi:MAG: glycosyltransferase family 1 protein [Chloroflexi bacterium]|nr:MAG: glycosyltransferase family 1 protein [Chloroflexota bacterium]